jgi:hypothetical protein
VGCCGYGNKNFVFIKQGVITDQLIEEILLSIKVTYNKYDLPVEVSLGSSRCR